MSWRKPCAENSIFRRKATIVQLFAHESGVNIVLHHKSCLQVSWEEVRGSLSHWAEVNKLIMPFVYSRTQKYLPFMSIVLCPHPGIWMVLDVPQHRAKCVHDVIIKICCGN